MILEKNITQGVLLFVLICLNPPSAVYSVWAWLMVYCGARITKIDRDSIATGLFLYNSILVGILMGYLFDISLFGFLICGVASILTLLISYSLHSILSYYFNLPILNLPFTIVAIIIYLASNRYSNVITAKIGSMSWLDFELFPLWISGLFKAIGILLFMPHELPGMIILGMTLIYSRINFFLILLGYYSGTLFVWMLKGSYLQAFTDLYSFNFILIALALGGYFLIPSKRSYTLATIGVLSSAIILDAVNVFWTFFAIPAFTIPFTSVVLLVLHVLKINRHPYLTHTFLGSPEKNLEHFLAYNKRVHPTLPQPTLPFAGNWTIYQGFNEEWTHQGHWKYAVDFVITDTSKKTYRNSGTRCEDYFAFGKPILSPVSGTVVAVRSNIADNPIGVVDKVNNWGNTIILYSPLGYYVAISHLEENSITVSVDDSVSIGQHIGNCGNSGYSPEPHIHFQCQYTGVIGAASIPFSFSNAVIEDRFIHGPEHFKTGACIQPLPYSKSMLWKMQFILDDTFEYVHGINGGIKNRGTITVAMNAYGSYYFYDNKFDTKLYFTSSADTFLCHQLEGNYASPLKILFLAASRIPVTEGPITWKDELPSSLLITKKGYSALIRSLKHSLFSVSGTYTLTHDSEINGTITSASLMGKHELSTKLIFDPIKAFQKIIVTDHGTTHTLLLKRRNQ